MSCGSCRCLCSAHGLAHSARLPLQPHPSTTPPALTNAYCGPPLPGTPRSPQRERHHPHCTDEDGRLCTVMVFSWSSHSGPGKGIHTPFSWHHSTLPALLGGGGAVRNVQAQGSTHSPIVWVLPPAPWGFGQVAHPLTHTGEGRAPSPHLVAVGDLVGPPGPTRVSSTQCPSPASTFLGLPGPCPPMASPSPPLPWSSGRV